MWSRTLPIDGAFKLLSKMNLIDSAITYACDANQYDFALDLSRLAGKPADDVHLKIAMDYEDEGKVSEIDFCNRSGFTIAAFSIRIPVQRSRGRILVGK